MPTNIDSSAPSTGPRSTVVRAPAVCLAWMTFLGSHSVSGDAPPAIQPRDFERNALSRAASPDHLTALTEYLVSGNRLRNLRLAGLIESWLDDEDSDDEVVGPLLDQVLRENPLRIGE